MPDSKRFASSVARGRPGPTVPVPLETRDRLLAEMRGEPASSAADESSDMEIEIQGDLQPRSAPPKREEPAPADFEEISFDDL